MAKFLDRDQSLQAIIDVLQNAEKEVILIVPFIRMSPIIQSEIEKCAKNNNEILLIYRDNELHHLEKEKLFAVPTLTVMHHSYLHSKCYLNENEMVITSMNLYGPTEKRNREMGIKIDKSSNGSSDDFQLYYDGLKEVMEIIRASEIEKKSHHVSANGFNLEILKSRKEFFQKYLTITNRVFVNKDFEILEELGREPILRCFPYHEKLEVILDYDLENKEEKTEVLLRRVSVKISKSDEQLMRLKEVFDANWNHVETNFKSYQVYWNYHLSDITLYPIKSNFPNWEKAGFEERLKVLKPALNDLVSYIKRLEKDFKIY